MEFIFNVKSPSVELSVVVAFLPSCIPKPLEPQKPVFINPNKWLKNGSLYVWTFQYYLYSELENSASQFYTLEREMGQHTTQEIHFTWDSVDDTCLLYKEAAIRAWMRPREHKGERAVSQIYVVLALPDSLFWWLDRSVESTCCVNLAKQVVEYFTPPWVNYFLAKLVDINYLFWCIIDRFSHPLDHGVWHLYKTHFLAQNYKVLVEDYNALHKRW